MRTASRSRRTALTLLAAGIFVASGARADGFKIYQLQVYCEDSQVATVIFGHIVTEPSMGTKVMCAGKCPGGMVWIADVLAGLPAEVSAALTAKVEKHEESAAAGNGRSLASCGGEANRSSAEDPCKKNPTVLGSVLYSGEITCDCNADGQDETKKAFESCGLPSNWPLEFKSRCEDWVLGSGAYGYGTDISIQRQGRAYLDLLKKTCPALKCQSPYATCKQRAENEYEKCLARRKFSPLRPDCGGNLGTAVEKCEQKRDSCLENINSGGPDPQPQPLPTPPSSTPMPDRP